MIDNGKRTVTLHCAAVTDQLTPLRIDWTADNASNHCASWRRIDEHQHQVLVELSHGHTCCSVACSVSNGLSKEVSRSAKVCLAKDFPTQSADYRYGTLKLTFIIKKIFFLQDALLRVAVILSSALIICPFNEISCQKNKHLRFR